MRDTCESHARCNVVEVMGRGAGDIAIHSALATGSTAVVVAEIPSDANKIIEKIKNSRSLGKRNFIVVVSESMGESFSPALAEKIEADTGVETRFARFAHVVRGGVPTLRDRFLASRMGERAVVELFNDNSNIVICERNGDIVVSNIDYALTLDHMYKNKLKDGELNSFTEAEIAQMKAECEEKQKLMKSLYTTIEHFGL